MCFCAQSVMPCCTLLFLSFMWHEQCGALPGSLQACVLHHEAACSSTICPALRLVIANTCSHVLLDNEVAYNGSTSGSDHVRRCGSDTYDLSTEPARIVGCGEADLLEEMQSFRVEMQEFAQRMSPFMEATQLGAPADTNFKKQLPAGPTAGTLLASTLCVACVTLSHVELGFQQLHTTIPVCMCMPTVPCLQEPDLQQCPHMCCPIASLHTHYV